MRAVLKTACAWAWLTKCGSNDAVRRGRCKQTRGLAEIHYSSPGVCFCLGNLSMVGNKSTIAVDASLVRCRVGGSIHCEAASNMAGAIGY